MEKKYLKQDAQPKIRSIIHKCEYKNNTPPFCITQFRISCSLVIAHKEQPQQHGTEKYATPSMPYQLFGQRLQELYNIITDKQLFRLSAKEEKQKEWNERQA